MVNLRERFLAKIVIKDTHWIWIGSNSKGRGMIRVGNTMEIASRVSLHLFKEFDLESPLCACHRDDLCDRGDCVNPDHLYEGSYSQNTQDSILKGTHHNPFLNQRNFKRVNSTKTHCPKGHEYTPKNTMISRGSRKCRICAREWRNKCYHKNKDRRQQ